MFRKGISFVISLVYGAMIRVPRRWRHGQPAHWDDRMYMSICAKQYIRTAVGKSHRAVENKQTGKYWLQSHKSPKTLIVKGLMMMMMVVMVAMMMMMMN